MSDSATPTRRLVSIVLAVVLIIGGAYSLYDWGKHEGVSIVVLVGTFAFMVGIVCTGAETYEFLRGSRN